MIELPIIVKKSTLAAIAEHSMANLDDAIDLNDGEAIVFLNGELVRRLLDLAHPADQRIDDVILRRVV